MPFFLPDPDRGGRQGASVRRSGGGLPRPTAAGGRGKRKRRARASHPRAHLGLGRREEPNRRRRTKGGGGARGGGAVKLGEGLRELVVRCGAARTGQGYL
jgi:hypothetical protein